MPIIVFLCFSSNQQLKYSTQKQKVVELINSDSRDAGLPFHVLCKEESRLVIALDHLTKNYTTSTEINLKFQQLHWATIKSRITGNPRQYVIDRSRQELVEIILTNKNEDWGKIVNIAMECYGDPKIFWKKVNTLRGQKTTTISKPLIRTQEVTV